MKKVALGKWVLVICRRQHVERVCKLYRESNTWEEGDSSIGKVAPVSVEGV